MPQQRRDSKDSKVRHGEKTKRVRTRSNQATLEYSVTRGNHTAMIAFGGCRQEALVRQRMAEDTASFLVNAACYAYSPRYDQSIQ